MKYYKDPNTDAVFAYESDGSQDAFIRPELEPITEADAIALTQAAPAENKADTIRAKLMTIDARSMRPARAVALAIAARQAPNAADVQTLADLEQQAIVLRAELAALA